MPYRDFEEFIGALNLHSVRYLIIGAHAVAFHARPRATKDLDVFVEGTQANARRVVAALRDFFGGADLGYTVEDVTDPSIIMQIGVAPVRIDILSRVKGCPSFRDVWKSRVDARFGPVPAHYLGLDDLIRAKQEAGRPLDEIDVGILLRSKARKSATSRKKPRRADGRSRRKG